MAVEMKNSEISWVGSIPSKWKIHPLKLYFGERVHPNSLNKETNLLSLSYGKIIRKDIKTVGGLVPTSYSTYNIIEPNDIVIRPTDLQNDRKSLRTGLCKEHGIVTSAYITIKPVENIVPAYFHYLLHSYDISKVFYNMGSGVRQGLNFDEFSKLLLIEPPLSEQKAIANFLDEKCAEIDGLLADLDEQIKTLRAYEKSLIAETVTHGLNPYAPMKQTGVGWIDYIPEHWKFEKFKHHLSPRRVTGCGDKQVLSVYREFGVIPKDSRDDNHNVTSDDTSKYKHVRVDDFVINKMKAWQGSMGVSQYEGIVSPAYLVYSFSDNEYYPRYFNYLMRNANYIPEYRRLSGGIREGQWDLSPYELGKLLIIIPPIQEQIEIAKFLDEKLASIEELIAEKHLQTLQLKEYKSSLIYEYVTGKKQVL